MSSEKSKEVFDLFFSGPVRDGSRVESIFNEKFMYSIYRFYGKPRSQNNLAKRGIHDYARTEMPLILDSGGYQYLRKALGFKVGEDKKIDIALTAEELSEIYKRCDLKLADRVISLDLPPLRDTPHDQAMEMIKFNNKCFFQLHDELLPQSLAKCLVPVIHGWDDKAIKLSMSIIDQADSGMAAIGGFFPTLITGHYIDLIAKFKIILKLLKNHEGMRFHGLGASGSTAMHVCAFAGIEQTDTASWRHNAWNMRLCFAELRTASISLQHNQRLTSNDKPAFKAPWRDCHEKALIECDCPSCKGLSLTEKYDLYRAESGVGFKARSIHNLYHYALERDIAREHAGKSNYKAYLMNRFGKVSRIKAFINVVDESRHQVMLDRFFKTNMW